MARATDQEKHMMFALSSIFIFHHHKVLNLDDEAAPDYAGWLRNARFVREYLSVWEKGNPDSIPVTNDTIKQMAEWMARHFIGSADLPADYSRRTDTSFRRVAKAVMKLNLN